MVDFYKLYKKVPGGMLIIPMILFAIINTLFPNLWTNLGDMSMYLFKSGTLAFAALILFSAGAGMDVKTIGVALKRSAVLTIVKLLIGFGCGFGFIKIFGIEGVAGVSAIAFVTCITSANPGVFMGLIQDYGEPADMGNFAILNIITTPAIPLLILATASGGSFNPLVIVSVLLPFVLGMIMGNLDPNLANIYKAATPIALPFMGCCFGSSINLVTAAKAGIAGIILSVSYIVIHLVFIGADKLINRRPGYCAAAMSSVAGIALIVPSMLAENEAFAPYISDAVSQIALCILITSIASPYITKFVVKKWGSPKCPLKKVEEHCSAS